MYMRRKIFYELHYPWCWERVFSCTGNKKTKKTWKQQRMNKELLGTT